MPRATCPVKGGSSWPKAKLIVFGSPTYMGNVSWQFKKFVDATSSVWAKQGWKDKLASGFPPIGQYEWRQQSTLGTLFTLSQQHSMLWVGTGLMPSNSKAATRDDINYLASFSGLMTATPSDANTEEMVSGDLATAGAYGTRLAQVLRRFN